MHFQDKFIAFVDILGFSDLVESAEREGGGDFSRAIELTQVLADAADANKFFKDGPKTCPGSRFVEHNLNFQVTQISDCAVISAEASPAGIINLAVHCFGIALGILHKGALCRGLITRGNIYHKPDQFFGTGYMRAYRGEEHVAFLRADSGEKGTPFIQIDDTVIRYVRDETDDCVRKMFGRITRTDGTYSAIYPFDRLARVPSSVVARDFDPQKWKLAIQTSIGFRKANLSAFEAAELSATDETVKLKIKHYRRGLEEVIALLRARETQLDMMIRTGKIPYGTVW
jgi:hypothetical protein